MNNFKLEQEQENIPVSILEYLNKCRKAIRPTNSGFRPVPSNLKFINARLKESYSFEDFKTVIDYKCKEWSGTKFEKYLVPKTLFCPSHFDTYLTQAESENVEEIEPEPDYIADAFKTLQSGAV